MGETPRRWHRKDSDAALPRFEHLLGGGVEGCVPEKRRDLVGIDAARVVTGREGGRDATGRIKEGVAELVLSSSNKSKGSKYVH